VIVNFLIEGKYIKVRILLKKNLNQFFKVIALSFYGDVNSERSKRKGYFEGILANLKLFPMVYPGWTIRLYHDLIGNDPLLQVNNLEKLLFNILSKNVTDYSTQHYCHV
jgi:hypothetical protein